MEEFADGRIFQLKERKINHGEHIMNIGEYAPDFTLQDKDGKTVSLSDFKGRKVVLYFYPKDNTPGCTRQAIGFAENYNEFKKRNITVIGISKDSVESHVKFAEKNNLPKVIRQFITTHHGAGKTKYFYISWKNEHPGEEPDPSWFNYPGPNPFTAEQAILMMADAVEAASRSLQEYTEESITQLVDKIIDAQVAEGYFNNCPITFQDIQTVKDVFKSKLKSMYHPRIKYPELK